jgi:hypothetical protein
MLVEIKLLVAIRNRCQSTILKKEVSENEVYTAKALEMMAVH